MKSIKKHFRLLILLTVSGVIGVFILVPDLMGNILLDSIGSFRKAQYLWIEVPAIEAEISKSPSITLQKVVDFAPPDELGFLVTFEIVNKGSLTLHTPRRTAFGGPEPFIGLIAIDTCEIDFSLGIGTKGKYPDLRFDTVYEVIENYEMIYMRVQDLELCQN
jgi:hypothetical protein